jgi:hypothetical protein
MQWIDGNRRWIMSNKNIVMLWHIDPLIGSDRNLNKYKKKSK